VRRSSDLKTWGEPTPVFAMPDGHWGPTAVWAPEMHRYRGKYYLFATFMDDKPMGPQRPGWPPLVRRATQILVADAPTGPFTPFGNRPHTPDGEITLDGTLWVEGGVPYMVYCHEWIQIADGGMKLIRLKKDLSEADGPAVVLFKGSDAPWAPRGQERYVTDGPALYRSKSGKLFMLWSSFSPSGYTTGMAISDTGKVAGPWRQQSEPFYRDDGGHAMIFRDFRRKLRVALHAPNRSPDERCRLFEVQDTGETLRIVADPKARRLPASEGAPE
jgi:GH43 family beta-xylosidase